jgi:peroxiredoxin
VKKKYGEIAQLGGRVLAVSFAPPEVVAEYERSVGLPFPVVSDPECKAYAGFGLGQTSWKQMLRPGVIARFVRTIFRGWLPRKPSGKESVFQLGGDFVLDGARHVIYAHPSEEPTDRPKVRDLLEALRRAAPVRA